MSSKRPLEDWPRLEVRTLIAYRGNPPAPNRHLSNANGFHSFWILLEGQVRIAAAGNPIVTLTKGDWVFVPAFLEKRQDFADSTRLISVGFDAIWSDGQPWVVLHSPVYGQLERGDPLAETAHKLVDGLDSHGYRALPELSLREEQSIAFHASVLELVARLTPILRAAGAEAAAKPSQLDRRLSGILSELQVHPNIRALPFESWRKSVGLSRAQIDRLTRTGLGASIRKVRDRYLLAAAKRRLLYRRESVKEIAGAFGFTDSSHFCRWFRQHAGQSPQEFSLQGVG